jgi:formylglycine-generating enzyme required for sulfatase activity
MGSPDDEPGRVPASDSPSELLRRVRISRNFAVATKEVTVEQFQRFLDDNPEIKARFAYAGDPDRMSQVLKRFSPDAGGPQIAVTWYEAAMYCNWLSKKAGLPENEWVYPKDPNQIRNGMSLPVNYLRRTGYRLPTEAEWEYVARSGSTRARFFGTDETMLERYAWYSRNPPRARGEQPDPYDPHERENRRVSANPEGDGCNRNGREARRLAHQAEDMADV